MAVDLARNRADFHGHSNRGVQIGPQVGGFHYHAGSDEDRCHQTFRLVHENGAGYEFYKDRIDKRVDGTCLWFLNHDHYVQWKKQRSGVLLVSADPGCGKSVLARYLVDHDIPGNVLYFFFKDQDQNTLDQCLCALLHQLFIVKPSLIKHALSEFAKNGANLKYLTKSLWNILLVAVDDNDTGPLTIILDALDECIATDLRDLVNKLAALFPQDSSMPKSIKFLLTSRPYQTVITEFWELAKRFPRIRIPGEEYSDQISREVNCVIQHRVDQLAHKWNLKESVKNHLKGRLLEIPHRTYLWVYLVFDYINQRFKQTTKGVDDILAKVPKTVDEAYERLLSRCTYEERVRKALMIIIAAKRPLNLQEMNIAVEIETSQASVKDLDLEDDGDFAETLRNWCGLFISVYNKKVYLIHQTAREFLLQADAISDASSNSWRWKGSIANEQADALLASICVAYLRCQEFRKAPEHANQSDALHFVQVYHSLEESLQDDSALNRLYFFDYSTCYWAHHMRDAKASIASRTLDQASESLQSSGPTWFPWLGDYETLFDQPPPGYVGRSALPIACYLGLTRLAKQLLGDPNERSSDGSTPLCLAIEGRSAAMVRLLLENGADVHLGGRQDEPLLHIAVRTGDAILTRMLLLHGADIHAENHNGETALVHFSPVAYHPPRMLEEYHALDPLEKMERAPHGTDHDFEIAQMFLDRGVDINKQYSEGASLLSLAVSKSHVNLTQFLLARGANVDLPREGRVSPLNSAAAARDAKMTQILLARGANVDLPREGRVSPLISATAARDAKMTQILLARGALISATAARDAKMVQILLAHGASVDEKTKEGQTALFFAAHAGEEKIVRLLLEAGASVIEPNNDGETPIVAAGKHRKESVLRLLLEHHAKSNARSAQGAAVPLPNVERLDGPIFRLLYWYSRPCRSEDMRIIRILLEGIIDVNGRHLFHGETLLNLSLAGWPSSISMLLVNRGADVNAPDGYGRSPLHCAILASTDEAVVHAMIDRGARVDAQDHAGLTALHMAAMLNSTSLVTTLLNRGASMDVLNCDGQTPLQMAREFNPGGAATLFSGEMGSQSELRSEITGPGISPL